MPRRRARSTLAGLVAVVALTTLATALATASSAGREPAASAPAAERDRGPGAFDAAIQRLERPQRRRMRGVSHHRGCPVPMRRLRLLRVEHFDFDRDVRKGRLVVGAPYAKRIVRVMRELYRQRFPIRRMNLIDRYGGSDHRSMDADNTSAFNCREVAGRPGVWSQHAYGRAIDLNPVENPYVTSSGYVSPPAGAPYRDRSNRRKGMVTRAAIKAFRRAGWEWGGDWRGTKDYQHFSSNGR